MGVHIRRPFFLFNHSYPAQYDAARPRFQTFDLPVAEPQLFRQRTTEFSSKKIFRMAAGRLEPCNPWRRLQATDFTDSSCRRSLECYKYFVIKELLSFDPRLVFLAGSILFDVNSLLFVVFSTLDVVSSLLFVVFSLLDVASRLLFVIFSLLDVVSSLLFVIFSLLDIASRLLFVISRLLYVTLSQLFVVYG